MHFFTDYLPTVQVDKLVRELKDVIDLYHITLSLQVIAALWESCIILQDIMKASKFEQVTLIFSTHCCTFFMFLSTPAVILKYVSSVVVCVGCTIGHLHMDQG